MTEASKVLEMRMSTTAIRRSALRCTYTGAFPGPTPRHGLPASSVARTALGPPVVQMKLTPEWWKRYWETSSVGSGITCRVWGGRPTSSPAAWRMSIARDAQRAARADERLEQRGRGRVGDRQQAQDDADRLGHVLDVALDVLVDHPDRALVLEVVVQELGGDVVLDHLVLEHPEAGLLHRQVGELDGALEPGHDHRPHNPIDRFLVEVAEGPRCRLRSFDVTVESFDLRIVENS